MSTKKIEGPKLFFHQSFVRTPSSLNMQDVYTNRQELAPFEEELLVEEPLVQEETKKTIPPANEKKVIENEVKMEQPEVPSPEKPKARHRSSLKRVKAFKEMDLPERLEYLINFPKVLPPVPCVFNSTEGDFQGYLTEYTDQSVTVRFHDQSSKTIPLEQLTNVIMIGIKR